MGDIVITPRPPAGWPDNPAHFWPEPLAPLDVAKQRRALIEYYSSPLGIQIQTSLIATGRQLMVPDAPDYEASARVLCGNEVARLAEARLYYIAAETVALVGAAYDGFPDTPSRVTDPPSECGFVLFGAPLLSRPVSDYDARRLRAAAVRVGVDPSGADDPVYVIGASWGPFAPDNWAGVPGYWVSFYAATTQAQRYYDRGTLARAVAVMPGVNPENETAWQCLPEELPPGKTEADYVLPDDRSGTAGWARVLSCLWAMMRQEHIVAAEPAPVPKTERKRHTRQGLSDPRDVLVVSYRRHVREEEDEVNAALAVAGASAQTARGVRSDGESWYRVRFPVSAHWRNQWYPSEGVHRPKRIPASWKGPKDAPVRIRDRIELF